MATDGVADWVTEATDSLTMGKKEEVGEGGRHVGPSQQMFGSQIIMFLLVPRPSNQTKYRGGTVPLGKQQTRIVLVQKMRRVKSTDGPQTRSTVSFWSINS